MPKTGNIFLDFFSFISIILPLFPVAAIFVKKKYRNESFNFLMIACALNFIKNFLLFISQINIASENIIINIFTLIEFIMLVLILKNALPQRLNKLSNIFLIAFLPVIVTIYLLKGIEQKIIAIEWLQNVVIISISILSLAKLTDTDNLYILNVPLFWIAIGTLFYFSISVLLQAVSLFYAQSPQANTTEKAVLLNIGNIARYFFYLLAAFFYQPPNNEKENSLF